MQPLDAVSLARYTIDKYGSDAAKPSVLLARAVLDGAHERDSLRVTVDTGNEAYRVVRGEWKRRVARAVELGQEALVIARRWVGHDGPHEPGSDYRADQDRLSAIERYLESLRE
jgi:hypothetical protein